MLKQEKSKVLQVSIYTALLYRMLLMLLFYTLCRLGFYWYNIELFSEVSAKGLMMILLGGLKFDISALFYINSLFILLQIIPFKFRYGASYQHISKYIFIITNSLGILANLTDFVYYPFTLKRTTASVFSQFSEEQNKASLFFDFIGDFFSVVIIFIFLVAALYFLYQRVRVRRTNIKPLWLYYTQALAMMLLITYFVIVGMRGGTAHSTRPITLSNAGEFVELPKEINLVLNTPFSIMKTMTVKQLQPVNYFNDDARLDSIYNVVKTPEANAVFQPKNVVIIILESWGKENIGFLNKELDGGTYKGFTPFIDSLMEHGTVFTDAYANGRKSIEGLPSIIGSIPGSEEPFVLSYYSGNKINGMGSLLDDKGYHTSFFHGAPNGSMGFSSFVKMAGIKHYFGKSEYNNDDDFDGIWGIWDEEFFQFFADKLQSFPQPFFSTIFSVSSHHPFKVPERYTNKFPKGPLPVQECIAYTDYALRQFFAKASKMPWFNNTLFVITADHATVVHHEEYNNSAGAFAIPLLIYEPGNSQQQTFNQPAQQIDIMPTILGKLNYDQPFIAFGNNLLKAHADNFTVNYIDGYYQIFHDDYLLQFNGEKTIALYNRNTDTMLKNNLAGKLPQIQQKMETMGKAFIQQYNNRLIENKLTIE
jgi:phosphoglycerol transferase MdoB-like AlkP superfamily enzyme